MLRWQDERGQRLRQEYIAVAVGGENGASVNPKAFSDWLLPPAGSVVPQLEAGTRNAARGVVDVAMDAMLAQRASGNLHPESREWPPAAWCATPAGSERSEEHTSALQSLMRISYAVFCLKHKTQPTKTPEITT